MTKTRTIKVLTWNLNTGHGPRGNVRDRIGRDVLIENLDRIALVIKTVNPDFACLQEVDFRWAGTHNINQRRYLREATGMPQAASTMHHRRIISNFVAKLIGNYIPSIFERYFGTAILSKFPIIQRTGYTFGQDFSRYETINEVLKLLNESKGYTKIEVEVDGRRISVMDVHLVSDIMYHVFKYLTKRDIYGITFVKEWQVQRVLRYIAAERNPLILAGDLNSIPPESERTDFAGDTNGDHDNYTRDKTMRLIRESGLIRTFPILFGEGNAADISRCNTYPTLGPNRVLDYIFVTPHFEILDCEVLTGHGILAEPGIAMPSDHLPVLATVRLI
ncbi:MAG: endonuclease/exonuclease/phosphatase family protein [Candidatus Micrarchaeota archaeon]|nr:endonuclease/exonuclease/phosphatase family protein [Candidatus Micrarchaeota archaeon]